MDKADGEIELRVLSLAGEEITVLHAQGTILISALLPLVPKVSPSSYTKRKFVRGSNVLSVHMTVDECGLKHGDELQLVESRQCSCLHGDANGKIDMLDLETGELSISLSTNCVYAISVDWATMLAAVATAASTLELWNLELGEMMQCFSISPTMTTSAWGFSVDWTSLRALVGTDEGLILLVNLEDGSVLGSLEGHSSVLRTIAVDWHGMRALSGGGDKTMRLWDLSNSTLLRTFQGHKDYVRSVAAEWDGMKAISGGDDEILRSWNLKDQESTAEIRIESRPWAISVNWERSEVLCALGGHRRFRGLQLWDTASLTCLRSLTSESTESDLFCLHMDWNKMKAVTGSKKCQVWDIATGECLQDFGDNKAHIWCVSAQL